MCLPCLLQAPRTHLLPELLPIGLVPTIQRNRRPPRLHYIKPHQLASVAPPRVHATRNFGNRLHEEPHHPDGRSKLFDIPEEAQVLLEQWRVCGAAVPPSAVEDLVHGVRAAVVEAWAAPRSRPA